MTLMALSTRADSQASRPMRIGVVFYRASQASLTASPSFFLADALRAGLRDRGWVDGTNVRFEWRSAESRDDRIQPILEELLASGVDMLALSGNNIVEPAMKLTKTVPIVMLASTSPVESGLVPSLARPGGNVTGVTLNSQPELVGKRLELLAEAVPGARRVALLHDGITRELTQAHEQAARVGLQLMPFAVDTAAQFRDAMKVAAARGAQAASIETSYVTAPSTHPEVRAMVTMYRLPMILRFREAVLSGHALMSYAPDPVDDYRRAAAIIDRILRGARPGEIPVETSGKFYLDINLRLAQSIGWKIPSSVIVRADNVIGP
jgi:putative ABC transport system substrate-binding protein